MQKWTEEVLESKKDFIPLFFLIKCMYRFYDRTRKQFVYFLNLNLSIYSIPNFIQLVSTVSICSKFVLKIGFFAVT